MKERPILFSAPMVRAILDGTKTQTRRVCKMEVRAGMPEPEWRSLLTVCPYGRPGDERLWVRETWRASSHFDKVPPREIPNGAELFYEATSVAREWRTTVGKMRPSIHMPRWASRITLEITGVRVELLQDISDENAIAEGCPKNHNDYYLGGPHAVSGRKQMATARKAFRDLWESLNGPGSREANPWVWVVEFKRLEAAS
jgi:hypothetical protein